LKRLQNLPVIKKGKHLNKNFILHVEIESVKILCEQETFAQLDGELISGTLFHITVMPKRYLFTY
jgi:diacylglycerol kinase family enzyme